MGMYCNLAMKLSGGDYLWEAFLVTGGGGELEGIQFLSIKLKEKEKGG